jgi:diguanylate cyclase (GGDEF)-like protein
MIHNTSEEKPFRIHMIDVNDFKQVNDKYGHIVGDRALQLVADALRNVAGQMHGFCARYGGDEFVLILNDEAEIQKELQDKVNLMREQCADLIPAISVSTGCTVCKSNTITATQLIAQADEQLYLQKKIFHGKKKHTGNPT